MGAQVEAATGGQDVISFCGGLRAVLAAVGIPLQKALSSSLQPSCIDDLPKLQTDHHRDGDAAVTLAGGTGGLHLSQRLSSEQQGQQPEWTQGNPAGGGVAVLEGAQQNLPGSAKDQVGFGTVMLAASAQHLPGISQGPAQHLHSICPASALCTALHSFWTAGKPEQLTYNLGLFATYCTDHCSQVGLPVCEHYLP